MLDVDNRGLLVNLVYNIFAHKGEGSFLPNALKISLAPTNQERPLQVMFVGTQQQKEQQELNTRERKGQDATKITSAFAETCIQFLWSVVPITALTLMVKKNS